MAPLPDAGQDEEPATGEPQQVSGDGVTVRKVPDRHSEGAVAIDLTIRSDRDDHCVVRLTDTIPEPVRDNPVEFHPGYDPSNWRRDDDALIYEAPIGPGVTRRTVYGIVIDDPAQLALFSTPPAVETADHEPSPADDQPAGSDTSTPAKPFEFGAGDDARNGDVGDPMGPAPGAEPPGDGGGSTAPAVPPAESELVESLLEALRREELSEADREALRTGLGLEPLADLDARLETLGREVEALASADGDRADPDEIDARLETVSSQLEERVEALSEELEALERRLDREERWRASVRQTLASDPPGE